MDVPTLIGVWWTGHGPVFVSLALIWALLIVLARQVRSNELPKLWATLGLLMAHLLLGLVAAAHSVVPDPGHQWALLGAQLFAVLISVSLFNHLVLGIVLGRFKRSVPTLLRDVLGLVVILIAAVVIISKHGFDIKALLPTGAVLTAVIGLALQQTLGNLIGGLSLQFDKSVRVGDWISVENLYGRVTEIRWRATSIETNDFETVIVPNAQLLAAKILVRGRRAGADSPWRRWIRFKVAYSSPPAEVIRVAVSSLAEPLDGVASWPPPNAIFCGMEDGIANYALRYWLVGFDHDDKTDSDVRLRLLYHLRRAGFEPALPAHQVTLQEDGKAEREAAARQQQTEREEALHSMELFRQLQPDELVQLARDLRSQPFGPGEALCRQGESADSLFIVRSGRVHVRVQSDGGEKEVAQLGPGSYFGEMGLMTGEPRTATVVAEGHVDALRLGKEPFRRLLSNRPELAESIAEVLAHRRVELEAVRDSLDQDAKKRRQREHHNQLLGRIRDFFGHREN